MTRRAIASSPARPVAAEPPASIELEQLARLARTLRPDWRGDIWLYYQTRSDLISRLHRAARRAEKMERELAQMERALTQREACGPPIPRSHLGGNHG